jgi:hypothetical protein
MLLMSANVLIRRNLLKGLAAIRNPAYRPARLIRSHAAGCSAPCPVGTRLLLPPPYRIRLSAFLPKWRRLFLLLGFNAFRAEQG